MQKLTKSVVDREQPGEKERYVWDAEIKGFGLKVFPSGTKSFVFQYRTPEGQSRRLNIGKLSDALTTDQARKIAKDHAASVHAGRDPQGDKQERRAALTVNELLGLYVASARFAKNAESTRSVDKGRMDWHLRPLLGREIADKVTRGQVERMHADVAAGKTAAKVATKARGVARVKGGTGTADKCVVLLATVYQWAVGEGLLKSSPVPKIAHHTGTRETILGGADDYGRLFATLDTMEREHRIRPAAADALRFVALTGARRGEVVGLRWAWVDLEVGIVTLPPKAHKAGHRTGKSRIIALPAEAQAIIERQPAGEPDDFVFNPAKGDGPISLNHVWPKVRDEAGLPAALTLHGLRHSLGSHMAMGGASQVEIMEQLGHRQASTTQRYIHFAQKARVQLAERAAAVALAGLRGVDKKD